jgi:hypothetical protein
MACADMIQIPALLKSEKGFPLPLAGEILFWLKIAILTKQGLSLDLEKASSIALSLIWSPGIFHS